MTKFDRFRKIHHAFLFIVVAFIAVYTVTINTACGDWIGTASAVILLISISVWLLTYILWCKCPHCGKRLAHKYLTDCESCPHCKKPFDKG